MFRLLTTYILGNTKKHLQNVCDRRLNADDTEKVGNPPHPRTYFREIFSEEKQSLLKPSLIFYHKDTTYFQLHFQVSFFVSAYNTTAF